MAKKYIEIRLKTIDEVIEKKILAIVTENSIKYNESDIIVSLKILDEQVIMIRENNEYRLQLNFSKNRKTQGNYLLKNNNITFDLEILTKNLDINEDNIHIVYEFNNEIREYTVSIKE